MGKENVLHGARHSGDVLGRTREGGLGDAPHRGGCWVSRAAFADNIESPRRRTVGGVVRIEVVVGQRCLALGTQTCRDPRNLVLLGGQDRPCQFPLEQFSDTVLQVVSRRGFCTKATRAWECVNLKLANLHTQRTHTRTEMSQHHCPLASRPQSVSQAPTPLSSLSKPPISLDFVSDVKGSTLAPFRAPDIPPSVAVSGYMAALACGAGCRHKSREHM